MFKILKFTSFVLLNISMALCHNAYAWSDVDEAEVERRAMQMTGSYIYDHRDAYFSGKPPQPTLQDLERQYKKEFPQPVRLQKPPQPVGTDRAVVNRYTALVDNFKDIQVQNRTLVTLVNNCQAGLCKQADLAQVARDMKMKLGDFEKDEASFIADVNSGRLGNLSPKDGKTIQASLNTISEQLRVMTKNLIVADEETTVDSPVEQLRPAGSSKQPID